ncbi:cupin domain-containing protein [Haloprofundus halobius]|uniref:cupin domain-containing protein n=1 Tax=Haloprofundus halobius TaxID=2876194 RepID=UPI001CCE65B4|nr:cupin domain-containing protein [Haloprofundus halobius]
MSDEPNEAREPRESHTSRIVRPADDWTGESDDGSRWKRLAQLAGGDRLGCTLEELLPGHDPLPYHYHTANEEAMYVLDGRGTLRTPAGEAEVRAGDYVSFPVGEDGAHTVENASQTPLRYLAVSTMIEPDVVVYPDEETLCVNVGAAPGRPRGEFTLRKSFSMRDGSDV